MTTYRMGEETRPIGWFRSARKAVERFPETVKDRLSTALTIAAEGGKADIAKPLKGLGPGVTQMPCVTGQTLTVSSTSRRYQGRCG